MKTNDIDILLKYFDFIEEGHNGYDKYILSNKHNNTMMNGLVMYIDKNDNVWFQDENGSFIEVKSIDDVKTILVNTKKNYLEKINDYSNLVLSLYEISENLDKITN